MKRKGNENGGSKSRGLEKENSSPIFQPFSSAMYLMVPNSDRSVQFSFDRLYVVKISV